MKKPILLVRVFSNWRLKTFTEHASTVSCWATVCKTVRPMLSVRCLSVCLSCLSAVCDVLALWPTVGRIKTKLGMQVGLGPGHIVLDGDPAAPPQRGTAPPIFGPYLLRPNGCMDQDVIWYGARPRPRRLCDGDPAPPSCPCGPVCKTLGRHVQ